MYGPRLRRCWRDLSRGAEHTWQRLLSVTFTGHRQQPKRAAAAGATSQEEAMAKSALQRFGDAVQGEACRSTSEPPTRGGVSLDNLLAPIQRFVLSACLGSPSAGPVQVVGESAGGGQAGVAVGRAAVRGARRPAAELGTLSDG